jgi:hypothetical protein
MNLLMSEIDWAGCQRFVGREMGSTEKARVFLEASDCTTWHENKGPKKIDLRKVFLRIS